MKVQTLRKNNSVTNDYIKQRKTVKQMEFKE